jgi:hypothetical protein
MSRAARMLWIFTAVFWQLIGAHNPFDVAQHVADMSHLTVHAQQVDHHHHDDHSLHVDESDERTDHHHADTGFPGAALLPPVWPVLSSLPPAHPLMAEVRPGAPPCLAGPLRPPMFLA